MIFSQEKLHLPSWPEKYSDDTGSATKGGELGWANPEMYVPEFRDMVKAYPSVNSVSHSKPCMAGTLCEVEERRNQANTPEALENRAYQLIYNRRFAEESQTWMDELRDEAFIQFVNGSEAVMNMPRIVITPGEPAGIGPDLILTLADQEWPAELVIMADPALLQQRADKLGKKITIRFLRLSRTSPTTSGWCVDSMFCAVNGARNSWFSGQT